MGPGAVPYNQLPVNVCVYVARSREGQMLPGHQWQIIVTVACSLTIVGILVGVLVRVVKRKRATTWYPDGYQLHTVSGASALTAERCFMTWTCPIIIRAHILIYYLVHSVNTFYLS